MNVLARDEENLTIKILIALGDEICAILDIETSFIRKLHLFTLRK